MCSAKKRNHQILVNLLVAQIPGLEREGERERAFEPENGTGRVGETHPPLESLKRAHEGLSVDPVECPVLLTFAVCLLDLLRVVGEAPLVVLGDRDGVKLTAQFSPQDFL
jgi:hypothetical protein